MKVEFSNKKLAILISNMKNCNFRISTLTQNLILFATLIVVIFVSVIEGRYRIDPHHWGIMLSSAKDLVEGKLPYKEIYNIYGILTTVIHAIAYRYLGGNLVSIIQITAVFYVIGLWILHKITFKTTKSIKLAWFVFIICILIHPVAIYPWSNYIAFPFLMGGIYFLLLNKNKKNLIISGILFSMAFLSREGVAIPVVLIIITFSLVDYVLTKIKIINVFKQCLCIVVGLLIPILIFTSYLMKNELEKYWVILSVSLPKIYAQGQFPHMSSLKFLNPFLLELWNGLINLDVHWICVLLMLVVTIFGLIFSALKLKSCDEQRLKIIKLSFASLILLITTLHIPEIFRISTGSIVGIIVLFYWLKTVRLDNIGLLILSIFLGLNLFKISSGNPFYPEPQTRTRAEYIYKPDILKGQLWPIKKQEYYLDFQNYMNEISKLKCNIKYHYNETMDTMLYALSPFERFHLTPYLHSLFDFLRPDLDYKRKISEAKEIIIFKIVSSEDVNNNAIPKGYVLFKKLKTTQTQWVYKQDDSLIILIPAICID